MIKYDSYRPSGIEWLGDIPSHWDIKKIGQSFFERKEKVSDKDFAPLSVTKKGVVPQLDNAAKSSAGDDRKKVLKGDFVINSRSDRKGSSGVSPLDGSVSLISIVLEPKGLNSKFIHNLLRSYEFTEEFYRNGQGIVADLWSTKYSLMKSIYIPIPSKKEQEAIANFLDKKLEQVDNYISKQKELIELLKEKKSSLINQAVTKGLDPKVEYKESGIEWLGKIPKHWEVKKLKFCLKKKLKYGANESAELNNKNFPRYIRITDFNADGNLREETFKSLPLNIAKDYLLEDGDILFARSGGTVGKTFQFKNYEGEACFAGYLIKATLDEKILLSDFLYQYTKSSIYERWKEFIFNKATIENIGADKYSILLIPIPPKQEQKQIVEYIEKESSKIDKVISTKEDEIKLLDEYKQSLISSAVTGKIKVS